MLYIARECCESYYLSINFQGIRIDHIDLFFFVRDILDIFEHAFTFIF